MGSRNKIIKGVFWTTFFNIANAVYGFIAVPILIKYFGKAEYGLIGLALSINVYMRLMDLGLNSTNVRFFSVWLSQKKYAKIIKAFQTSLTFYGVIGLINSSAIILISLISDKIFNVNPEQDIILKHLLYILSFSAFCNWFTSCFDQLIKATENIDWIQRIQLISKLLQIVVLFLTVYVGLSIETYFLLTTFATICIIPLLINKIRYELPCVKFRPKLNISVFKEMLPYSLSIFSFGLFQFSFYNLRPVFLGIQGSAESVADFRIMNGIIGIVHLIGGAFTSILLPSTSKVLAEHNVKAYYQVAYDGTKYISVLLCFCTFGVITVAPEILTMYVGEEYLYLLPWFYLWLLCNLVTHNQAISSLILAGNDIRAISYCSAIASLLGLLFSWFLIPIYQVGGVVFGFLVYGVVQMLFYYLYYWPKKMKINSLRVLFYSFGPYLFIGFLCSLFCNIIKRKGDVLTDFLFYGFLFSVLYSAAVYMSLTNKDKSYLWQIKKKIFR